MRINLTGQSTLFNATAINQKFHRTAEQQENQSNTGVSLGRRDSVSLSKQGKKDSMLQQLMNQKQLIQESRDALLKDGVENGQGVDQSKLDEYEEQLKRIDEQIAQAMAEEPTEEGKNTENKSSQKVTKEEYQNQKMFDIVNISSAVEHSKIIMSARESMEGEANVLKAQISADGGKAVQSKFDRIAKIEAQTSELMEQTGEELSEATDNMDEDE